MFALAIAAAQDRRPGVVGQFELTHSLRHVWSNDYAGVGYGYGCYGWAFARDNIDIAADPNVAIVDRSE